MECDRLGHDFGDLVVQHADFSNIGQTGLLRVEVGLQTDLHSYCTFYGIAVPDHPSPLKSSKDCARRKVSNN